MYYTTHCPFCGRAIADYEDPVMSDENEQAIAHLTNQTKLHIISYHPHDIGEKKDKDIEWDIRKSMKMTPSKPPGT